MRQFGSGGFSSRCDKIDIMLLLLFNETFYTGELMLYKNEAIFSAISVVVGHCSI